MVLQFNSRNLIKWWYNINIINHEDFRLFLEGSDASKILLFVSITSRESLGIDTNNMYQQRNPTIQTIPRVIPRVNEICNGHNDVICILIINMYMSNVQDHIDTLHLCPYHIGRHANISPTIQHSSTIVCRCT